MYPYEFSRCDDCSKPKKARPSAMAKVQVRKKGGRRQGMLVYSMLLDDVSRSTYGRKNELTLCRYAFATAVPHNSLLLFLNSPPL